LIRETVKRKKNPVHKNKNQAWEPMHQKYKANENKSKHNPKKKQKQTINNNQVKTLCNEDSWLQKDLNYSSTTRKKIADWPPPRMDGIKA